MSCWEKLLRVSSVSKHLLSTGHLELCLRMFAMLFQVKEHIFLQVQLIMIEFLSPTQRHSKELKLMSVTMSEDRFVS